MTLRAASGQIPDGKEFTRRNNMKLHGGLIAQALMGGGSGGETVSDMIEVFKAQTPIVDAPIFGDYWFRLVKLPEGYYYPIASYYSTSTNKSGQEFVYESSRYIHPAFAFGYGQGESILYVDNPIFNNFEYVSQSYNYDAETDSVYLSEKRVTKTIGKLEPIAPEVYNWNVRVEVKYQYQSEQTLYNVNGEIADHYINTGSSSFTPMFTANNWYYTPFKGDELLKKINEVTQDIYIEYMRTQSST